MKKIILVNLCFLTIVSAGVIDGPRYKYLASAKGECLNVHIDNQAYKLTEYIVNIPDAKTTEFDDKTIQVSGTLPGDNKKTNWFFTSTKEACNKIIRLINEAKRK